MKYLPYPMIIVNFAFIKTKLVAFLIAKNCIK